MPPRPVLKRRAEVSDIFLKLGNWGRIGGVFRPFLTKAGACYDIMARRQSRGRRSGDWTAVV